MSGLPEHPSRDHLIGNRPRWAAGVVRYALDLRAQRDKAIADRKALESAIKQHKQATESRLHLLAQAARQPEKSDLMLKPDADLYAALNSIQEADSPQEGEGR